MYPAIPRIEKHLYPVCRIDTFSLLLGDLHSSTMSSSSTSPIICPNCGSKAIRNYCSQCGQPTHLHKDTFPALVGHFFSHYLHYESRLFQSIKILWTRPGQLSVDYREKRRARHTDPLSMYIFIVVVYFIANSLITSFYQHYGIGSYAPEAVAKAEQEEALRVAKAKAAGKSGNVVGMLLGEATGQKVEDVIGQNEHDHKLDKIAPRMFFFMVPVLAFILALFLFRLRNYGFVDHAVFALHMHAFWFSFQFFIDLLVFIPRDDLVQDVGNLLLIGYLCRAMVRFYGIRWGKALLVAIPAFLIYVFALMLVIVGTVVLFF